MRSQGEAQLNMLEPGGRSVKSAFQVADVTPALYSVPKLCGEGCEFNFAATDAVATKGGQVVTRFAREGVTCVWRCWWGVEPSNGGVMLFAGQGVRR